MITASRFADATSLDQFKCQRNYVVSPLRQEVRGSGRESGACREYRQYQVDPLAPTFPALLSGDPCLGQLVLLGCNACSKVITHSATG